MNSCLRMTITSLLLITIKIVSLLKAGDFYCYLSSQEQKEGDKVEENLVIVNSDSKVNLGSYEKIDQQKDLEVGP